MHMVFRLGIRRSCRGKPSEHMHVFIQHMHVSSVACVLNMLMNGPLIMIAYMCLIVYTPGLPPMYVQAPAVLADTAVNAPWPSGCEQADLVRYILRSTAEHACGGWVHEWITSIQLPGLMKLRLMHHQEHHLGYQAPQNKPCNARQIGWSRLSLSSVQKSTF